MKALILTDLQYDFMPGGALAVAEGDQLVPLANRLMRRFSHVVATQDWHPPHHLSFASQHPGRRPGDVIELDGLPQVLWPDHCIQESDGARLHLDLDRERIGAVVVKGTNPRIDSYSGFFDNEHRQATELERVLDRWNINCVYFLGLATDYCVMYSALDAVALGFETWVIRDACRAVNLNKGDGDAALRRMMDAGVQLIDSRTVMEM